MCSRVLRFEITSTVKGGHKGGLERLAFNHVSGIAKFFLKIWCPGEDSNLHTVASTST